MRVRFERNVCRTSARPLTGLFKRGRLGMPYLFEEVEAFAGDLARGIDDHCADKRAGANLPGALRS